MRLRLVFLAASILAPAIARPLPAQGTKGDGHHQPISSQIDESSLSSLDRLLLRAHEDSRRSSHSSIDLLRARQREQQLFGGQSGQQSEGSGSRRRQSSSRATEMGQPASSSRGDAPPPLPPPASASSQAASGSSRVHHATFPAGSSSQSSSHRRRPLNGRDSTDRGDIHVTKTIFGDQYKYRDNSKVYINDIRHHPYAPPPGHYTYRPADSHYSYPMGGSPEQGRRRRDQNRSRPAQRDHNYGQSSDTLGSDTFDSSTWSSSFSHDAQGPSTDGHSSPEPENPTPPPYQGSYRNRDLPGMSLPPGGAVRRELRIIEYRGEDGRRKTRVGLKDGRQGVFDSDKVPAEVWAATREDMENP